ncbi:Flp family type IVb pilin [Sphingobium sp. Sx8-8]|uniref:Flp family type IVb pilin n=1 Tax=Sphingobium sp. Sx8-8 TaxID=2933617 RepID=UPI0032AF1222
MGCAMRALMKTCRMRALARCQRGATVVEYGLILGLIFLAMVVGVSNLGIKTVNQLNNIAAEVSNH